MYYKDVLEMSKICFSNLMKFSIVLFTYIKLRQLNLTKISKIIICELKLQIALLCLLRPVCFFKAVIHTRAQFQSFDSQIIISKI